MPPHADTAMLATLGGFLALLLGLLLLLLPLLASELSRARDSVWGGVVLLLGLVLVTSAERLTGAPMLAVLCGGLVIGRLGVEVGQARWRMLSDEERQRLWSWERWRTSLDQLGAALARLVQQAAGVVSGLGSWLAERRAARPAGTTKRWVRPEPAEAAGTGERTEPETEPQPETQAAAGQELTAEPPAMPPQTAEALAAPPPPAGPAGDDAPRLVESFEEIDTLLQQAPPEPPATAAGEGRGEAG